ncbi:MAG: FdrA family protein, partial [Thermodesulfobacteriota bacterium]
ILSGIVDRIKIYPNKKNILPLDDPNQDHEHYIIDLGNDYFTEGKLHPMMNPQLRNEWIIKEAEDDEVRVILLDVVLGYGSHPRPIDDLTNIIAAIKKRFNDKGRHLVFVVHLCGTEKDPQGYQEQKQILEKAGAVLVDSSTEAAMLSGLISVGKN